jgi:Na+-translocating ferredoxin:NAD+ oxidoreductase RnfD subunit
MLVIAVLFAISLFCIGAFRLYLAFAGKDLSGAWRVVHGVLVFIILIAGIILVLRKDMDWRAPAAYIATVSVRCLELSYLLGTQLIARGITLFSLVVGGSRPKT